MACYDPCTVISFTRIVSDQSAENIAQTLGSHSYKSVFLLGFITQRIKRSQIRGTADENFRIFHATDVKLTLNSTLSPITFRRGRAF